MGESDKTIEALRARLETEDRKINLRAAQTLVPAGRSTQPSTSEGNGLNAAFFGQGNSSVNTNAPRHSGNIGRGRTGFGSQHHSRSKQQIARDIAHCKYSGKSRNHALECRIRIAEEGEKQPNGGKKGNYANSNGPSNDQNDFSLVSTA